MKNWPRVLGLIRKTNRPAVVGIVVATAVAHWCQGLK